MQFDGSTGIHSVVPSQEIRPLQQSDIPALCKLISSVGWSVPPSRVYLYHRVGRTYGCFEGATLIASTTVFEFSEDVVSVANVIVTPTYQKRGIGRQLLSMVLAESHRRAQLVATPAGVPLYTRLGFQMVEQVIRLGRASRTHPTDDMAETNDEYHLATLSDHQVEEIINLDQQANGYRRASLFAALKEISGACLVIPSGISLGAAVCIMEGDVLRVGPVIAQNVQAAQACLTACAKHWQGEIRMDVLGHQRQLISQLKELGFVKQKVSPLMRLASDWASLPGDPNRQFSLFDSSIC